MSMQTEPRFRINAKQNAKGKWYFDGTAEYKSDKISLESDTEDIANVTIQPLGLRLLSMLKETESAFRDDGKELVGDNNEL